MSEKDLLSGLNHCMTDKEMQKKIQTLCIKPAVSCVFLKNKSVSIHALFWFELFSSLAFYEFDVICCCFFVYAYPCSNLS